jgi:RNAse (barnase) inhibitor barstar
MTEPLPDRTEVEALVARLRDNGFDAVWIDRAPVFDRTTLFHALYQSLHMPAWFGFNWDALADMLYGDDDPQARPVILVFRDLDLLEAREPETARTFLEMVDGIAAETSSSLHGLIRAGHHAD